VPELPETETIARDLDGALRGAVVRSVAVHREDVLRDPARGGRALKGDAAARWAARVIVALAGGRITAVHRRAKSIVIAFDIARYAVVTPRFTGALLLADGESSARPHPHDCLTLGLGDGRTLTYRDLRRLGTFTLLESGQFGLWNDSLGPEPLDPELTAERFSGILRGSGRAVKSILMDQRRLAGVGNIYANEACWRARVRPARRGRSITRAESSALLSELRGVLAESIALRGTTFRDFQDAYGGKGGFAPMLQAYGRAGLPCTRCGGALRESHALEGRSTVWCPRCQR
jgi:formamidopyrimidine-DNA glycosylase